MSTNPCPPTPLSFIHWSPTEITRRALPRKRKSARCFGSSNPPLPVPVGPSTNSHINFPVVLRFGYYTHGLQRLPYDLLIQVFLYLSVTDLVTMSLVVASFTLNVTSHSPHCQVSHLCYDVSSTYMLWKRRAHEALLRARPLHLIGFEDPERISPDSLKRSVQSVHRLEKNWSRAEPKQTSPSRATKLNMSPLDCFCYAMKFSSRYLLLPTKDGYLVGWDNVNNSSVGRFNMNNTMGQRSILINVRVEFSERSLYCIIGKVLTTA